MVQSFLWLLSPWPGVCPEKLCIAETSNLFFFFSSEKQRRFLNMLKIDSKVAGVLLAEFLSCMESRT